MEDSHSRDGLVIARYPAESSLAYNRYGGWALASRYRCRYEDRPEGN
jgi:hypothetical protein